MLHLGLKQPSPSCAFFPKNGFANFTQLLARENRAERKSGLSKLARLETVSAAR